MSNENETFKNFHLNSKLLRRNIKAEPNYPN